MNRRTSRSTSGERQEVERKRNKAIGKKTYKFKKLTLYKETKQNKTIITRKKKKLNEKEKEKKRRENKKKTASASAHARQDYKLSSRGIRLSGFNCTRDGAYCPIS